MQFNVKQSQKKFNPVTAELTFESQEELNWFLWITNTSIDNLESANSISLDPSQYYKAQMSFFDFAKQLHEQYSV